MRFSEQWLREWVDPPVDTAALTRDLSMMGLEVDAVLPAAPAFAGVVIATVVDVEPHPQAERLHVCSVDDGSGTIRRVVCGAPNVVAGMKAAFAPAGTTLPDGTAIRRTKIRGVTSQGMLCSPAELGLSDDAEGLLTLAPDAPVGADLRAHARLDDRIIEVELTPDRGDCLSIAGIARDVAARYRLPVAAADIAPVPAASDARHAVALEAPDACPRYCGRVIEGVDPAAPTPDWMAERLRRGGIRPLAVLVDIGNYVMLELGQPLHAFDRARLQGDVRVRRSGGERLLLLDGREVEVDADTLVIADERGPIALAGIMGGADTAVGDGTRDVFLESACFLPPVMAGRARRYTAHTDAAHRFERGVDFELAPRAIERATRLIVDIAGGTPGPAIDTVAADHLPVRAPLRLRAARMHRLLGFEIGAEEVEATLRALGLDVERADDEAWRVTPPSWRYDLGLEADVIEEVVRIHGCDRVPRTRPAHVARIRGGSEQDLPLERLRRILVERDWFEAVTYSFVDHALQRRFDPDAEPLALVNPIASDMAAMRTHLWPGLVGALRHNLNRQQGRVRLFEAGLRFLPHADGLAQEGALAGVAYGPAWPEQWGAQARAVDFYDVKGDVEALLAAAGPGRFRFEPAEHPALHPGQTARVLAGGEPCGWLGTLHPRLQRALELAAAPVLFELDLRALARASLPQSRPLSRYPAVRRDLAVIVDESVPADGVLEAVREAAPEDLREAFVFDVYRGLGIDSGRKSLALGLILQGLSRTLTDEEVEEASARILDHLKNKHGATLRE